MFKMFLMVFMAMFLIVSSIDSNANACDFVLVDISQDDYDKMCPYGDAVVVDKNGQERPYDCVDIDSQGNWLVGNWDDKKREWQYKHLDPNAYKVYTMDGQLIRNAKGDVIVLPLM